LKGKPGFWHDGGSHTTAKSAHRRGTLRSPSAHARAPRSEGSVPRSEGRLGRSNRPSGAPPTPCSPSLLLGWSGAARARHSPQTSRCGTWVWGKLGASACWVGRGARDAHESARAIAPPRRSRSLSLPLPPPRSLLSSMPQPARQPCSRASLPSSGRSAMATMDTTTTTTTEATGPTSGCAAFSLSPSLPTALPRTTLLLVPWPPRHGRTRRVSLL
jgi:hypothetical protein